ncbi:MAG: hypothetical protein K9G03_02185 [Pontimonas sp.]|nr:hypothetical protein [Pontimonas sp.]
MTNIPPAQPMTRRERRQLEEQGLLAEATPVTHHEDVSGPPITLDKNSSVPPEPPTPPISPAAPAPMTRRERKMLEETGVIPIPVEYQQAAQPSTLEDTSLVEVTQSAPVVEKPAPSEPLPPVFGPPATSPAIDLPPNPPTPLPENPSVASSYPSRVVGDVTMATSSLILPTTPTIDMSGPIGDTGEVIVTGQITLPNRLAETGTIPSMREDKDDDEQFDAYVTGELAAMSQPVRASKAVSGQGDDTDILLVRRVRWGTAAILTATGAAVLGIGAVVLLVVALLTDTLV